MLRRFNLLRSRMRQSWPTDPRAILRRLGLPGKFTLAELLDAVSADRRRRLLVRERALPPEFSALWLATNIHDLIVVAMGLSRLQRDLAVAHECSHMLLEHGSQVLTTPKQLEQALSTTEALFVLARSGCGYDEEQERAAELLATEICLRLDSDTGPSGDKTEWFQRHIS